LQRTIDQLKQQFYVYLKEKNIQIQNLSASARYDLFNKFLESDYSRDSQMLPEDMKFNDIEKEDYLLHDILNDLSLQ